MNFLVDHNLRGHGVLLSGSILNGGRLDWIPIRFIKFNPEYRERCATRLVEIVLDIDGYRGVSRLFIP